MRDSSKAIVAAFLVACTRASTPELGSVRSCPSGTAPCEWVCADIATDHDHCGGCDVRCAEREICSGGVCCGSGTAVCSGVCVALEFDRKSCGQCGLACSGATPYCDHGKCSACNPAALLVMDGAASENQKLAAALERASIPVHRIDGGIELYNGAPSADEFGAIVLSGGGDYFAAMDMPRRGQLSITGAHARGVGVVLVEPLAWARHNVGYLSALEPLFLATGSTNAYMLDRGPPWPAITKTSDHPIWDGVPATLLLEPMDFVDVMQGSTARGATPVAQCVAGKEARSPCDGAGTVLVRSAPHGRIVHFNATINDSTGPWADNEGIVTMMVNAVRWVSECR